ncbi:hypothetical protein [Plastoroseomonas hellenica]|uniref:hypothetical protein n=1 Tax=Plastoroseomonas hellenica TaxID=2687306 RepID=UPI001BAD30E8|nr:hypothetical protein [Plastoroseomonas hellenica]MBR0647714.1 hypothetical protein [Plastoroseomonas hellenica]
MFMDEPPTLQIRMLRQRLPQFYRGRRWIRRGNISRVFREFRIVGMVWSDPPGARDRRIPRGRNRYLQRGEEEIIIGCTPGPGFRPTFTMLPREAIRAFNATMRAFRDVQHQA